MICSKPGLTRLDTDADKVVGQKLWLAGRSSDDNSPRRDRAWRLLIDAGSAIRFHRLDVDGSYADCTSLSMISCESEKHIIVRLVHVSVNAN